MISKICTKCNQNLYLHEFNKTKNLKSGYENSCKKCRSEQNKFWKQNNKERNSETDKIYRNKNKHSAKVRSDNFYVNNKEYVLRKSKENYEINKEHKLEKAKQYRICKGITTGTGETLPEKQIREWLIENNIKYEKEKWFNDCMNEENTSPLFFDFYLPEYNILIEFDGIHHFQPIWSNFEQIRNNDNVKDKYCLENNIKLLRINYLENILEKLECTI